MSTAVAASSPKKTTKKRGPKGTGATKKASSHPTYQSMIKSALVDLKESKGSSKAAILKYILQHYKVGDNVKSINAHLRMALKRCVTTGMLKQTKGTGASGSFRLGDKAAAKTKKTTGEKKPRARKTSKTKVAKATGAAAEGKPVKTKSPKKSKSVTKKAKSPKKPKSPKKKKAAKSPKKVKSSPKKTKAPRKKASPKKAAKSKA